jgi:hypothetical protein
MIFDQPHLYEIEDLINFAANHQSLYIYGCGEIPSYMQKFLNICGTGADGYVQSQPDENARAERLIPVHTLDALTSVGLTDAGIIVGLSDKHYGDVIPRLRAQGFNNYFLLSEHSKRALAHKLTPRPRERMWIEINLVDHCNLNCQMCDHFSHLAPPSFLSMDEFKRDLTRLAALSGHHIDSIKLQGGEPLLHKETNRFIETTRELFPLCEIVLFTNGLLLLKAEDHPSGNFWRCCAECNVSVLMTRYPINIDVEQIIKTAEQYGADLQIFGEAAFRSPHGEQRGLYRLPPGSLHKESTKHPFDLSGGIARHCFISCYHFNETVTLRHGRLYTCCVRPYAEYFNAAFNQSLELKEADGIDIYKADSYEALAEFAASPIPFCRYCDIKNRRPLPWAGSKKTIDEYIDNKGW